MAERTSGGKNNRRIKALDNLRKSYKSGFKTYKGKAGLYNNKTLLTEKDKARMKREGETLKTRIK